MKKDLKSFLANNTVCKFNDLEVNDVIAIIDSSSSTITIREVASIETDPKSSKCNINFTNTKKPSSFKATDKVIKFK